MTSELEAVRTFLAGLDLLGDTLPIESEAHSLYVVERSTWANYLEALEQDAPPWEPEIPEIPEIPETPATWGQVTAGDQAQAPNGEWYRVDTVARIGREVRAHLIVNGSRVPTTQDAGTAVTVRRGPEGRAVDVFAAAGMTLERIGR